MSDPLLVAMAAYRPEEPAWINDQKIEMKHIAKALHCSVNVLYTLAQAGKCPFIAALKDEDKKSVTYMIWPGLAEAYIGRERLRNAVEGKEIGA